MRLPLAGTDDALGILAQFRGETVDAGGDAGEHRKIRIGGDHRAHQGDILCEATRGGNGIDAVALERGQQSRERLVASEIASILKAHAHSVPARPPFTAGALEAGADVACERCCGGDDRQAFAQELEFDQQPRERDEIVTRRTQYTD